MEVSGQLHALTTSILGKDPDTHRIGGWMGHKVGLDATLKTKSPFLAPARN